MLGPETIARMSDIAAYRAAEEGRYPLTVWQAEDIHGLPFLGTYCPPGWRPALWEEDKVKKPGRWVYATSHEEVLVEADSSGFGSRNEPALTFPELGDYVMEHRDLGWAIVESGQFQVVVGGFVRDQNAPGKPAPDAADLACEDCGEVHGPFEECDEYGLQMNCDHEHVSDDEVYPEGAHFGARIMRVVTCDDCGAHLVPTEPDEDGNVGWEVE
jgi:hypothetical protein